MTSPRPYYHIHGIQAYSLILLFLLIFLTPSTFFAQEQLAFPTASGAGAYATGGRGKPVYKVTNLNNSGSGSFRQALEDTRDTDGGIITFEVSGTINLTSQIYFTNQDNITIAGQTAPEGGITIANYRLRFQNVNNLIMRYIRIRPGYSPYPSTEIDAFEIFNCSNYIIDHCSFSWGTDEAADSGNGSNYTWQRNLFAESNKTGMIMGGEPQLSENLSFINNMFYNCSHRFPNFQSNGRVDVINNVVWNWRTRMSVPQGGFQANHVNNYYVHFRSDPPADLDIRGMLWYPNPTNFPTIYTSGNYVSDVLTDPNADNWPMWRFRFNPSGTIYSGAGNESPLTEDFRTLTPFTQLGNPFEILSAVDAFDDIKYDVGVNARLLANGDVADNTDFLDDIYLTNVQNDVLDQYTQETVLNTPHRTEFLNSISTTPINTHPSSYDTDNDGMPDQWELNNFGNLDNNGQSDTNNNGYSDIEDFLNGVDFDTQGTTGNEVSVSANFETICAGDEVTLTATGAETYAWDYDNQTSSSFTVALTETTTFTVTGTHSDDSTTEASITITVNEIPTVNAGEDVAICQGSSVTLTASGGTSYEWSTGDTSSSITVNPNETTTYTVVATQNGCESIPDAVVVTVNDSPVVDAGPNETIFLGESVTLTATGADSYLWSTGETTQSITVNPIQDTSYSVTGTTNNCEDTDTVTVFLQDDSVDANAGIDTEICNGETVTLTATGGSTYLWSTGETTPSIEVSPTETTTYTVTAFSESGNNSEEDSVIVTVNDIPVADAGEDVDICFGNVTTLTASGGTSYVWSTGATTPSITVSPNDTTTYTVEVFENNCSSTDEVIVTVNQIPDVSAGTNVTIELGESATLTATGADTYLWETGATSASIQVTPTVTTTYTVTGFSNGCEASADVTVTVQSETVIANAGEDITICEGSTTTLTATGGATYLWNTGETTASIDVSPTTTTTYTVTAFSESGNQSDDDTVTVTVNALPIVDAGSDVTITEGESTTLTATGAASYLWSTGETTSSITVSPNSTAVYSVTGTTNGCESTDEITVTVEIENVNANAGNDVSICEGSSTTLTATGGTTYLWNTGETTSSISVSPSVTTIYTVTAFNTSQTASDEASVTVSVDELPATNAGADITITEGESTTLSVTGAESYLWSTGETTSTISVTPEVTTTYTVTGFSNQCEFTDEVTVIVEPFEFTASAGSDQTICQGYETTLTASEGDSYLWSTGETTQSITVNPANTQTYSVTVFQGQYQADADVMVSVNPNPNVVISNGGEVMILEGEFVTLSASGANTYLWNNGATQPNIAVSPSSTTTYEVTGYVNNCEDTKAVIVNVFETVEAYAGEDLTICSEDTVTLTAEGGDEYLWNTGETTQSIEVSPDEDTEYSVLVYNALDSDEATVTVYVDQCNVIQTPPESEDFDFVVFQEPTSDLLKVKINGLQNVTAKGISIYDMSGKILYTELFSPSESQNQSQMVREINTSPYARGIYMVRLIYDDTSVIKKIPIR
ncbi:T9SS type A sorting domain-containing protein [uncultured Psychroserpens sp.]|uniref:T9SS type A sorting domain-containing protein n=1 Tax=uncultured Psychroserpens sp. TaxID=255436 RepID=UPI00260BABFA|nr:T9SS type A sorting domain-containing protein [uncultured Psychroserpens sp.]